MLKMNLCCLLSGLLLLATLTKPVTAQEANQLGTKAELV